MGGAIQKSNDYVYLWFPNFYYVIGFFSHFNSFVTIEGIAEIISGDEPKELFKWVKIIVAQYMGNDKAEEYGRRNSISKDELLIKINPTKVIGQKDIAGW